MKGKRKNKDHYEIKEFILHFLDLASFDPLNVCPYYTSVVQRKEDATFDIERVDFLQIEIENLLVSVIFRADKIEEDTQTLENLQDKKTNEKQELERAFKRAANFEVKPCKKFKENSGKVQSVMVIDRTKKNIQPSRYQDCDNDSSQKTESANPFWTFLEPYYADITQDDINTIENWIKIHEDDFVYQKLLPLGNHYPNKWAKEDIQEEIKEGSKSIDKKKGLSNNSLNSAHGEKLLKKVERNCSISDEIPLGPLTQRLLSCLIEENLITNFDDTLTESNKEEFDTSVIAPSKPNFIKSLNLGNMMQLENRIRKELTEIGILDPDDEKMEVTDDEVLAELKKLQATLKPVCDYNLYLKRKLLRVAKEEMVKQEIKKKLHRVNSELLEALRKKQGKKLAKNENEQIIKTLKEQKKLINELYKM